MTATTAATEACMATAPQVTVTLAVVTPQVATSLQTEAALAVVAAAASSPSVTFHPHWLPSAQPVSAVVELQPAPATALPTTGAVAPASPDPDEAAAQVPIFASPVEAVKVGVAVAQVMQLFSAPVVVAVPSVTPTQFPHVAWHAQVPVVATAASDATLHPTAAWVVAMRAARIANFICFLF